MPRLAPAALFAAVLAMVPVLLVAALVPGGALAQSATPLTADEFEARVTGRTLTFHFQGQAYGVEQYMPGRRVLWSFIGDECQEGVWYPREDMICFAYDGNPDEQCWHFYASGTGLRGVFVGPEGPGTELYEVLNTDKPLICPGPAVGV